MIFLFFITRPEPFLSYSLIPWSWWVLLLIFFTPTFFFHGTYRNFCVICGLLMFSSFFFLHSKVTFFLWIWWFSFFPSSLDLTCVYMKCWFSSFPQAIVTFLVMCWFSSLSLLERNFFCGFNYFPLFSSLEGNYLGVC